MRPRPRVNIGVARSTPVTSYNGVSNLTWFDYDPNQDVLYVMKMASDLYRWQRKQ